MSDSEEISYLERKILAMIDEFGYTREELFAIVNTPCGNALDKLWRDIILKENPNYGDWEYPDMAYRHLLAHYVGLANENKLLRQQNERLELLAFPFIEVSDE